MTEKFRDAEAWTDPSLKLGRLAVLDAEADEFLAGLEPTDFVSVITRGTPPPALSLTLRILSLTHVHPAPSVQATATSSRARTWGSRCSAPTPP